MRKILRLLARLWFPSPGGRRKRPPNPLSLNSKAAAAEAPRKIWPSPQGQHRGPSTGARPPPPEQVDWGSVSSWRAKPASPGVCSSMLVAQSKNDKWLHAGQSQSGLFQIDKINNCIVESKLTSTVAICNSRYTFICPKTCNSIYTDLQLILCEHKYLVLFCK